MNKKIILYCLSFIMLGLFLSPSTNAAAVKLGRALSDSIDYNMKALPSRTSPPTKLECVRSKDCAGSATEYCLNNSCATCTYSCPASWSQSSTGKCESSPSSVAGVKVNSFCDNKDITCYSAGRDCPSGQVCAGNACVPCTYSCPSGYSATATGGCGSVLASVAGNKSNPACPAQNLSCYSVGTNCASSGQKCSGGSCVPMCTGVTCAADTQKCNTTTGRCDVCCTNPTNGYCKNCAETTCKAGEKVSGKNCIVSGCAEVVANKGSSWKAVKNLSEFNAAMNNYSVSTIVLLNSISSSSSLTGSESLTATGLFLNKTKTIVGPKYLSEAGCQDLGMPTLSGTAKVAIHRDTGGSKEGDSHRQGDANGITIASGVSVAVRNLYLSGSGDAQVTSLGKVKTGDRRTAVAVGRGILVLGSLQTYDSGYVYGYGSAMATSKVHSNTGHATANGYARGVEVVGSFSATNTQLYGYAGAGFEWAQKGSGGRGERVENKYLGRITLYSSTQN